ncbi:MAG: polysaccharide deacetylase family protein [Labilibaculum antarcticum]
MLRFKKIAGDILGFVLLLLFKKSGLKKFDKHVLSIYFHNPSSLLFKGIIRFLRANDFHFISENEMYKIVVGEQDVNERKVFISFDDAWKGNLKLIPVIEKYQIPISIFTPVKPVVSGNYWWEYVPYLINKYPEITCAEDLKKMRNAERMEFVRQATAELELTRSSVDLKELEYLHNHPLVTIGSHTYHHPISIKCTDEELAFEYSESKKILESWLNTKINSFAYPNGDYDERDFEFLRKNGYEMAFTTNPNLTQENMGAYEIPRVSINTMGGKYENISRMLGLWHQYIQPLQLILKSDKKTLVVQIIDQYS